MARNFALTISLMLRRLWKSRVRSGRPWRPCLLTTLLRARPKKMPCSSRGPSGCAKTLLGYRLALHGLDNGDLPLVVAAKNYQGNFAETADAEAVLLGSRSARAVISAGRRLNRQLVFVVDGYNECPAEHRLRLTRSMSALARRYDARIIISSQIAVERADLLTLCGLTVSRPDREIKRAIAMRASGAALPSSVDELIDLIDTGLEASLVGVIGADLPDGASRFAVFDRYVRSRLGNDATFGIVLLSRIAGMMLDQVRFTISARELDRLVDHEYISAAALSAVKANNLISGRGDRISFRHELFTYTFIAETIVRRANGNVEKLQSALRDPRHSHHRALILGAIDSDLTVRQILSGCTDSGLIRECLRGYCSQAARAWAEERCKAVIARVRQEAEQLSFDVTGLPHPALDVREATLFEWPEHEKALLAAIPEPRLTGTFLDEVLDAVSVTDAVLVREHKRLLEAAREKNVALRSGLFNAAYVEHRFNRAGITQIIDPIWRGMLYDAPERADGIRLRARLEKGHPKRRATFSSPSAELIYPQSGGSLCRFAAGLIARPLEVRPVSLAQSACRYDPMGWLQRHSR